MKRQDNKMVQMPKKTTYKKAKNGTVYVYLTLRAYRNSKGKPTSDEASIGKLAKDGVHLIPNQRYFEFFKAEKIKINKVERFADSAALYLLADRLGIKDMIGKCLPNFQDEIILLAIYMLLQGNVMSFVDEFIDDAYTTYANKTIDTSKLFSNIDFDAKHKFFKSWMKKAIDDEYIAYDVTSISTYSNNIEESEWGYNRDGDFLPQINLGMLYGQKTNLPIYYQIYDGSIVDKAHFGKMIDSAKKLSGKIDKFVFDKGFISKDNLLYLNDKNYSFISSISTNSKGGKELIDKLADKICKSRNIIIDKNVYALKNKLKLFGIPLYAHVYYSAQKSTDEQKILYSKIQTQAKELDGLKTKRVPLKYNKFFDVNAKENNLGYLINYDKVDKYLKTAGYFIIITDDENLSSKQALKTYRRKDVIEKAFLNMKNQIDFKRIHTHNSKTSEGKIFVGFISLILRSYVMNCIKADERVKNLSVKMVFKQLEKIKKITYDDLEVVYTQLSKKQKVILDALGISFEELERVK
jgi:transposase